MNFTRFTELDIMLEVAELGQLRANKEELKKMEFFMKGAEFGVRGVWKITDNKILYAKWEEDHFSPVYNVTYKVLLSLYGDEDEINEAIEDGIELSLEYGCLEYMIDENFETYHFGIEKKKEVE